MRDYSLHLRFLDGSKATVGIGAIALKLLNSLILSRHEIVVDRRSLYQNDDYICALSSGKITPAEALAFLRGDTIYITDELIMDKSVFLFDEDEHSFRAKQRELKEYLESPAPKTLAVKNTNLKIEVYTTDVEFRTNPDTQRVSITKLGCSFKFKTWDLDSPSYLRRIESRLTNGVNPIELRSFKSVVNILMLIAKFRSFITDIFFKNSYVYVYIAHPCFPNPDGSFIKEFLTRAYNETQGSSKPPIWGEVMYYQYSLADDDQSCRNPLACAVELTQRRCASFSITKISPNTLGNMMTYNPKFRSRILADLKAARDLINVYLGMHEPQADNPTDSLPFYTDL